MGVKIALLAAASVLSFVQGRAQLDGGYAETGRASTVALTATAVLAVRAADAQVPGGTRAYLLAHEPGLTTTEFELVVMAEAVTGGASDAALASLRGLAHPNGIIGDALNSTYWGVLALRQANQPVPAAVVSAMLRGQTGSGGFPWVRGGRADTDDTSAAVQALVAGGVRGKAIVRAVGYIRARENSDGGFSLQPGGRSNAQSTAWAIQALLAAGGKPPAAAFRYLKKLQSADGSIRYSAQYATTPLWVSAQALPALMRRSFPLK
jgi:Prenyltransferase and squalene oxidase repeat